jgi:hypothetical protein
MARCDARLASAGKNAGSTLIAAAIAYPAAVTAAAAASVTILISAIRCIGAFLWRRIVARLVALLEKDAGANGCHHDQHEQNDKLRTHAKSFWAG